MRITKRDHSYGGVRWTGLLHGPKTNSDRVNQRHNWGRRRWLPSGVVAQWQSTGGSSQRPWVQFPAAPLFISSPCRFKGLRTVAAPIVSLIDTITIGLRTTEESCPSDSSIAVITLSNSHIVYCTCIKVCLIVLVRLVISGCRTSSNSLHGQYIMPWIPWLFNAHRFALLCIQ